MMYLLYHGDYDRQEVIAVSPTRAILDEWVTRYESITPKYARGDSYVVEFDDTAPMPSPESLRPEWATETDEEYVAREAAEYAAHPEHYARTESVLPAAPDFGPTLAL